MRRARARSETLPIKGKAGLDCGRAALGLVRLCDCASAQQAPSWAVPGTADDVVVFPVYLKIPRSDKNSDFKNT